MRSQTILPSLLIYLQGTTPFLSIRLLDVWMASPKSWERYPSDDIEGFAWLLLWTMLSKAKGNDKANPNGMLSRKENILLSKIDSSVPEGEELIFNKVGARGSIQAAVLNQNNQNIPEEYPNIFPFLPLLHEWLNICSARGETISKAGGLMMRNGEKLEEIGVIEEETQELYTKVIDAGLKLLQSREG